MSRQTLIAFLRGVMPSGKNAVKMADVRAVLGGNGFDNVRTWIQSGNIALESGLAADEAAVRIHDLLHTHLNVDLAVIVKTPAQLREILDGNPFADEAYDPKRVFFTLCNAYLYIPQDASRSKLGNAFLEKQLGLSLTTRNGNTLRKMMAF